MEGIRNEFESIHRDVISSPNLDPLLAKPEYVLGTGGFLDRDTDPRGRLRRVALMAVIIAAHLVLATWILLSGRSFAGAHPARSLMAIDISVDVPKPDAPAKPAIVAPIPDNRMVALLPAKLKIDAAPPAAGTGVGNGCGVANAVSVALIADRDAMAELAALPAGVRSDADAVMLWNGAWLDAAPETQAQMVASPIPALKRAVTQAVLSLPAECQEVEVTGPQLLPITEPGRTTMVVIGSGVWRWSSLLEPPVDPETGIAVQAGTDWRASLGISGN